MNLQDIIDRMALLEREIFEKYKDTLPFPAKEFAEEIGIKVIKSGSDFWGKKDKDQYIINIPDESLEYASDRNLICMGLVSYFFEEVPIYTVSNVASACAFLIPEKFIQSSLQSDLSIEEIAKHLDVPVGILIFYINHLNIRVRHSFNE